MPAALTKAGLFQTPLFWVFCVGKNWGKGRDLGVSFPITEGSLGLSGLLRHHSSGSQFLHLCAGGRPSHLGLRPETPLGHILVPLLLALLWGPP